MFRYIENSQPFLEGYKNILDYVENNLYSDNPDIERLKSDFCTVLEILKRQIFMVKTFEKNFINFAEIYIKDDEKRNRFIKDVLITNARNINDFNDVYGGSLEDKDKPGYLYKNDDGEYYDIHNF